MQHQLKQYRWREGLQNEEKKDKYRELLLQREVRDIWADRQSHIFPSNRFRKSNNYIVESTEVYTNSNTQSPNTSPSIIIPRREMSFERHSSFCSYNRGKLMKWNLIYSKNCAWKTGNLSKEVKRTIKMEHQNAKRSPSKKQKLWHIELQAHTICASSMSRRNGNFTPKTLSNRPAKNEWNFWKAIQQHQTPIKLFSY